MGLFLFAIGHLFTMLVLAIVAYQTQDGKYCESSLPMLVPLLNPFSFYFFNSSLDYYLCPEL